MRLTAIIAAFAIFVSPAFAADFTARSGGPSAGAMSARSTKGAPDGLAFFRPVLSGVLYRSGFKGGDNDHDGLSSAQREQLCNDGFSHAFYADFGKNTDYSATSCSRGNMSYDAARSSHPGAVMKAIHKVAKNPGSGPVLVHCMWGVHSSGALSAMALVQFCGWSEKKAKAYWNKTRNDAPCGGGCDKWIDDKFAHFKADPSLKLSAAEMAAICPK